MKNLLKLRQSRQPKSFFPMNRTPQGIGITLRWRIKKHNPDLRGCMRIELTYKGFYVATCVHNMSAKHYICRIYFCSFPMLLN